MKFHALIATVLLSLLSAACDSHRLVYSNGFSFANYDYVVVAKPDSKGTTNSALYGMDVEFGNVISIYNMNVIGEREYDSLPDEKKARTLRARMAINANDDRIQLSVSFDDMVTDKAVASVTSEGDGNVFDDGDRREVFERAMKMVTDAIKHEKSLSVTDQKGLR